MDTPTYTSKRREWLRRYIPAEILGTAGALAAAWIAFSTTHSYVSAAAAGWVGEGIGFFGYFITLELLSAHRQYLHFGFFKRAFSAMSVASTNLFVEFLPAELVDNFLIRPYAMYIAPQYIHPFAVGFLAGKFSSDVLFYALAIIGYEARKKWLRK